MKSTALRVLKVVAVIIGVLLVLCGGTMLCLMPSMVQSPASGRAIWGCMSLVWLYAGAWLLTLLLSRRHALSLGRVGLLMLALGFAAIAAFPPAEINLMTSGRVAMAAFAVLAMGRLANIFGRGAPRQTD